MGLFDFFKKKKQKQQKRSFDAARGGNNTFNIGYNKIKYNQDIFNQLNNLRSASRQAFQNDSYFKRYVNIMKQNVIGADGFQLQNRSIVNGIQNTMINTGIEESWREFISVGNCDVTKKLSLNDILYSIVSSEITDGECFIRLVKNYNNKFGFAIQLIDVNAINTQYNDASRNIIMGIRYDDFNAPVSYFVSTKSAGTETNGDVLIYKEIPASEMIHIYDLEFIGQTRGVPKSAPVLVNLHNLKEFMVNANVNAAIGASKLAAIRASEDASFDEAIEFDDSNGGFLRLMPGEELQAWDPKFPDDINPFIKATIRNIAAGFNISYHTLAGDLESVNYSSARVGLIEDREHYKRYQKMIINQFLIPLFNAFIEQQTLMRTIKGVNASNYRELSKPNFMPKGFAWVDPIKEIESQSAAISSGLKTFSDIAAENGYDRDELISKLVEDQLAVNDAFVKAGLTPLNLIKSEQKSNIDNNNQG